MICLHHSSWLRHPVLQWKVVETLQQGVHSNSQHHHRHIWWNDSHNLPAVNGCHLCCKLHRISKKFLHTDNMCRCWGQSFTSNCTSVYSETNSDTDSHQDTNTARQWLVCRVIQLTSCWLAASDSHWYTTHQHQVLHKIHSTTIASC